MFANKHVPPSNSHRYGPFATEPTEPAIQPGQTKSLFAEEHVGAHAIYVEAKPQIDRNMQVAFQLAQTLKGRGKYRRTYNALSANQKHQVGNAICEHIIASLRNQAANDDDDIEPSL